MRTYRVEELEDCLGGIGVRAGETVLVHTALFALGRMEGVETARYPDQIYQTLRELVGAEGTIVVPTFNFDFCRAQTFDRQRTPSKKMGIFSEYVRTHPGAYRSSHPMQSLAAVGPLAERICRPDTSSAFDVRGCFAMLLEYNARQVFLGNGFVAASLVHYCEERVGVPYRFWKNFTGSYRDGDRESRRTYSLYARDLDTNPIVDPSPLGEALLACGKARRLRLGSGFVEGTACREFVELGVATLRRDRRALVHLATDDRPTF